MNESSFLEYKYSKSSLKRALSATHSQMKLLDSIPSNLSKYPKQNLDLKYNLYWSSLHKVCSLILTIFGQTKRQHNFLTFHY